MYKRPSSVSIRERASTYARIFSGNICACDSANAHVRASTNAHTCGVCFLCMFVVMSNNNNWNASLRSNRCAHNHSNLYSKSEANKSVKQEIYNPYKKVAQIPANIIPRISQGRYPRVDSRCALKRGIHRVKIKVKPESHHKQFKYIRETKNNSIFITYLLLPHVKYPFNITNKGEWPYGTLWYLQYIVRVILNYHRSSRKSPPKIISDLWG